MEYNFDILLAGCNTNCRHCYVDGGPASRMQTADFDLCMNKLIPVFEHFGENADFTLDNELYLHPDLEHIWERIHQECWSHYCHHGSTTGIAFNHRSDKEKMWQFQKENGIDFGCITLHGAADRHNFITRNPYSFDEALEYMRFVKDHHGKLYIALMLSTLLIKDRDEITELLREVKPDEVYFAVTNFAPSQRMLKYQPYRATYEECMKLKGYLARWGADEAKYMKLFETHNSQTLLDKLKESANYDFSSQPERCFLSVHQNLDLYYGNTGVETEKIGNLKSLSSEEIIHYLEDCQPNYNFCPACFSMLPKYETLIEYIGTHLQKKYIYPDVDSFLTYHLMTMQI